MKQKKNYECPELICTLVGFCDVLQASNSMAEPDPFDSEGIPGVIV